VLGIRLVLDYINGKTVPPGGRKHIDAAALQCRARQFGLAATLFESALFTEMTGTCSHAKSLIESLKKERPLQGDRNFLGVTAARFKQNGPLELIQHLARFCRERRVGIMGTLTINLASSREKWHTGDATLFCNAQKGEHPRFPYPAFLNSSNRSSKKSSRGLSRVACGITMSFLLCHSLRP
jgi:hypothetical protein